MSKPGSYRHAWKVYLATCHCRNDPNLKEDEMSQTDKNLRTSQHSPIPMRPPAAPIVPDYEFLALLFNMRLMEEILTPPEAYCLDQLLQSRGPGCGLHLPAGFRRPRLPLLGSAPSMAARRSGLSTVSAFASLVTGGRGAR